VINHDGQIAPLIDNKKVLMVLHLEPHFSEYLKRGIPAPAQVIIDGRNSNTALLTLGYLRSIFADFNVDWSRQQGQRAPPLRHSRYVSGITKIFHLCGLSCRASSAC
jgi:ABC-2 type transport system permease protein